MVGDTMDSSDHDRNSHRDGVPHAQGERWLEDETLEELRRCAFELAIPDVDNLSRDDLIHAVYSARRSRGRLDSHRPIR